MAIETPARKQDGSTVARKAAVGTLTTIAFRVLSFLGTQWCYRRLDPEILGQSNVQLELMLTSVLFLGREGFRLALTKHSTKEGALIQEGVARLSVIVIVMLALCAFAYHSKNPSSGKNPDFYLGGTLYCLAAAIEGLAEPVVLFFLRRLSIAEKATAEGTAALVKTAATVLALHQLNPITAFGVAQCAYAITYCSVLYGQYLFRQEGRLKSSPIFHMPTLQSVGLFTAQGIFKFGLTEGDRIVMAAVSDSYDQGVYAMASGYGGLAARMVFQPLEESARLLFGRFAASADKNDDRKNDVPGSNGKTALDPILQISYVILVKVVMYVGFIFGCLAVNYTQVLLHILAGRKWGDNIEAAYVLSAFCIYTAFLALNGMTEAFVYGVAVTASDVGRLSAAHTVTGILFAIVAPIAVAKYGTVGLVAANCIAMFGRSLFSIHFAAKYMTERLDKDMSLDRMLALLVRQMTPVVPVLAAFSASFVASRISMKRMVETVRVNSIEPGSIAWFKVALEHIGVGAACGIGTISVAFFLERDFRASLRRMWHGKTD
jgi:oligosaccharide translocation protein RFT1